MSDFKQWFKEQEDGGDEFTNTEFRLVAKEWARAAWNSKRKEIEIQQEIITIQSSLINQLIRRSDLSDAMVMDVQAKLETIETLRHKLGV